jgi:hypothetical protein
MIFSKICLLSERSICTSVFQVFTLSITINKRTIYALNVGYQHFINLLFVNNYSLQRGKRNGVTKDIQRLNLGKPIKTPPCAIFLEQASVQRN